MQLEPDDISICCTDGLSEAENAAGVQFSKDEILSATRDNARKSAAKIYELLVDAVKNFHGGDGFDDDLTLMVIKIQL